MTRQTLDCRGMNCPMPIVAVTKAIKTLASGDVLEVTATDLAFRPDIEAWSRRTGHKLESFEVGEFQVASIRVK
ncbi:MAG: sulfurtransferase TusA family protein [Planctomycetales bacterium]|nr:sulfurtransferase TusA family protein [Planctomycetales bacterium]